jgi:hypothetical protein
MKDKIEVPSGYGSVYPNSYWSGTPTPTPGEVVKEVTIEPTAEPIEKQTIFNKIISIFK